MDPAATPAKGRGGKPFEIGGKPFEPVSLTVDRDRSLVMVRANPRAKGPTGLRASFALDFRDAAGRRLVVWVDAAATKQDPVNSSVSATIRRGWTKPPVLVDASGGEADVDNDVAERLVPDGSEPPALFGHLRKMFPSLKDGADAEARTVLDYFESAAEGHIARMHFEPGHRTELRRAPTQLAVTETFFARMAGEPASRAHGARDVGRMLMRSRDADGEFRRLSRALAKVADEMARAMETDPSLLRHVNRELGDLHAETKASGHLERNYRRDYLSCHPEILRKTQADLAKQWAAATGTGRAGIGSMLGRRQRAGEVEMRAVMATLETHAKMVGQALSRATGRNLSVGPEERGRREPPAPRPQQPSLRVIERGGRER